MPDNSTSEVLSAITADQIVSIFREDGFSAERQTLQSGKPCVRFKVEGFNSTIYFYQEVEGMPGYYKSFQFTAGFKDKIAVEKANQWNRERRYIKVYADNDGELSFDQDFDLGGGVTKAFIVERIGDWRRLFTSVLAFVV